MGLFGKKKRKRPPGYRRRVLEIPQSREYRIFKKHEKKKLNWYEKFCKASNKIINVKASKKIREELEPIINFTGLRITPASVMSLVVVTIIISIIATVVLISFKPDTMMAGLGLVMVGVGLSYYFYSYPKSYIKALRIEASSQVVLAILYMVISMRISPNLERAMRFAATNVSGALADDMRKLIWDIEMGIYYSANEAMSDYIIKWKPENEEFAEALRLIRDSQTQISSRAKDILDESLLIILSGTKTRMKHYVQDLKMPVMVIHMMGIVLPILGTIMAPLAAVFLADLVSPYHFILGYDIVLPIIIIWFINYTLKKRPVTFSQVDISIIPNLPKKGHFKLKGHLIPALPIAILLLVVTLIMPIIFFMQNPQFLSLGVVDRAGFESSVEFYSFIMSLVIILGVGYSMAAYFILSNYQRVGIQEGVESAEGDFELALFQFGNRIAGGTPTEVAIEKSIGDMKDLKIVDLFKRTLNNIRNLGFTFERALFDRQYGSLRYYPSRLIRNVMYTVVETSKKGITYASEGMLRIARYLKNIKETQEYIRDLLSDTVSSMKFQAYFLSPMITGLVVSMSLIIIKVLVALGSYLEGVQSGAEFELPLSKALGDLNSSISPEVFQLIVGVYLIQVIIIFSVFLTKISHGNNKTLQWYSAGKLLVVAMTLYMLVAIFSASAFSGLIEQALTQLGILSG